MLYGAIEAGGTKFVCAVGNKEGKIVDKVTIPTLDPDQTIQQVDLFFKKYTLSSLGIGSFGPIELNEKKETYGEILNSPKILWKNFNVYQAFKEKYNIPLFLDTDVNASALGEYHWGAAKDSESCLYITVGTGIGAGYVKNGVTLKGMTHPEMGHIYVPRYSQDTFEGCCPYHKGCLEGLASGTAIAARYGIKGNELKDKHEVWELEAHYLAQAIVNYLLILSPEKIILGGGVMKQDILFPLIRKEVSKLLQNYITIESMDEYIVQPQLNDQQGILGALALCV
ncbi:ROK family protein [Sutcliffiella halmapala]|uniref:ROK family protein n=1 Tax=Sutcliffiella halmapala TaxID=79882 RepID=UPI000994E97A|nr:ROK family protein [Sutcliffiella halmapala]